MAKARPPLKATNAPGLEALWIALVELCLDDYEDAPRTSRDYRSAAAFLAGTRLLLPDGRIDTHGYGPRHRRTRKVDV